MIRHGGVSEEVSEAWQEGACLLHIGCNTLMDSIFQKVDCPFLAGELALVLQQSSLIPVAQPEVEVLQTQRLRVLNTCPNQQIVWADSSSYQWQKR